MSSMHWKGNSQLSIVWAIWKQRLSSPWNSINFTMLIYFNVGKSIFMMRKASTFCLPKSFSNQSLEHLSSMRSAGTKEGRERECVAEYRLYFSLFTLRFAAIRTSKLVIYGFNQMQFIIFVFISFARSLSLSRLSLVFQCRFYQLRCALRVSPRLTVQIETNVLECPSKEISSASVVRGAATSKIFQILYRNEEILLRDTVNFRARLLGEC